jgi:hypothetical protein
MLAPCSGTSFSSVIFPVMGDCALSKAVLAHSNSSDNKVFIGCFRSRCRKKRNYIKELVKKSGFLLKEWFLVNVINFSSEASIVSSRLFIIFKINFVPLEIFLILHS